MIRGDLVVLALQGSHGKPRPALVIQSDIFSAASHVAVLPLTTIDVGAALLRVPIAATESTGLVQPSFAMLERLTTAPRDKIDQVIGRVDEETMLSVARALAVFLGIA
jgi:mRNA interferase MazF